MAEIVSAADRILNYENKLNTQRLPEVLLPLKTQMIQRFTDYIENAVQRELTTQTIITDARVPKQTYIFYQASTRNLWKRYISNNSIWNMWQNDEWKAHWQQRGLDASVLQAISEAIIPA